MNSRYLIFLLSVFLVLSVDGASVSKKIKEENAAMKMEAREEVEEKTEAISEIPEIETVVPDEKPVSTDSNEIPEVTEAVKPEESPQETEDKPTEEKPSQEKPESNEIPTPDPETKPEIPEPTPTEETLKPENPDPPKRKTITYDQRQEGELNIRADLENFMIIFVPTKKSSDVTLLDLLVRNAAKNAYKKKKDEKVDEDNFKAEQTPKFEYTQFKENSPYYSKAPPAFINPQYGNQQYNIESRSPYKVDISSTLMHQEPQYEVPHQNPQQPLFQPQYGRSPFHPVNVPPQGNFRVYRSINDNYFDSGNEGLDLPEDIESNRDPTDSYNRLNIQSIDKIDRFSDDDSELTLLGATENCGPERKRDSYGVCQFVN